MMHLIQHEQVDAYLALREGKESSCSGALAPLLCPNLEASTERYAVLGSFATCSAEQRVAPNAHKVSRAL